MFRIYTKNQKSEEVFNINLNREELNLVMKGNAFLDHPELNPNDYIVVETEEKFAYPVYHKESNTIEEATREERILIYEDMNSLINGEYIEAGRIVTVPVPENLIKAIWNKETHTWEEGMTKEELIKLRTEKILKYSELEENKKSLEASKFSSEDEIIMITQEMQVLEQDINKLAGQIATLKL